VRPTFNVVQPDRANWLREKSLVGTATRNLCRAVNAEGVIGRASRIAGPQVVPEFLAPPETPETASILACT
jgi:hypothetical protein